MHTPFWPPFIASCVAALVTSLGILTIQRFEKWGRENASYFICFAAGILISASLLHIVPESIHMSEQANIFLLVGFFTLFLFNRIFQQHTGEDHFQTSAQFSIGIIPLIGIGIHSFLDGMIFSVTFSVSEFTGTLATLGMILHEFPEGIITYILMLKGGFDERKAFVAALFAAGLSTPLGMLLSYPFVAQLDHFILGILLAFSAGNLLYVGATHLLPKAEHEYKRYGVIALLGGVAIASIMIISKAHSH